MRSLVMASALGFGLLIGGCLALSNTQREVCQTLGDRVTQATAPSERALSMHEYKEFGCAGW